MVPAHRVAPASRSDASRESAGRVLPFQVAACSSSTPSMRAIAALPQPWKEAEAHQVAE